MEAIRSMKRLVAVAAVTLGLAGCGGGAETVELPAGPATGGQVGAYQGPAAESADVLAFQTSLWTNLRSEQRCGACHGAGGQAPTFADNDDVNAAYAAALPLVNLAEPEESRLVVKVGGGHNCWETSDAFCAEQIQNWVADWAGGEAGEKQVVQLEAPTAREPGASRILLADDAGHRELFRTELYEPILTTYCADCHSEDGSQPQSPFFASGDLDTAFADVRSKINLDATADSRLVVRLGSEFHSCWSNCAQNADEMLAAVDRIAEAVQPTAVDPALETSQALRFAEDGIVASSGGRVEDSVIALYQFRTGEGSTAFDSSGVAPALHLTLTGDYEWVGGWGVRITSGRAQGSVGASSKLAERLQASGEYSIEAWVTPGNVTQDGPARIVSYSGGNDERNFMLGQTLYDYNFHSRSTLSDADGEPSLSTPSADEVLQATLQHVVATYSVTEGRRLWVNGRLISEDAVSGGLQDWNDSFAFLLGNETSGQRQWQGVLRLVALHERALTEEDVLANFEAGVGEKFFLLFGVGGVGGLPANTYVLFQVSQFDSYAYLFETPHLVNLDGTDLSGVRLRGMRVGINGHEARVGQAWVSLDATVGQGDVPATPGPLGHRLSRLGTVIGIETGVETDEFFLTFDEIGSAASQRTADTQLRPVEPTEPEAFASVGLKTFEEIAATMSVLTDVPRTQPDVAATYTQLQQQLPTIERITSFLSAQQVGVAQLAMSYCNVMVEAEGAELFPGVDFDTGPDGQFADSANRLAVIDPLVDRFVGATPLATQPDRVSLSTHLDQLIDETRDCRATDGTAIAGCANDAERTRSVVKAACAALLGSATTLLQ